MQALAPKFFKGRFQFTTGMQVARAPGHLDPPAVGFTRLGRMAQSFERLARVIVGRLVVWVDRQDLVELIDRLLVIALLYVLLRNAVPRKAVIGIRFHELFEDFDSVRRHEE